MRFRVVAQAKGCIASTCAIGARQFFRCHHAPGAVWFTPSALQCQQRFVSAAPLPEMSSNSFVDDLEDFEDVLLNGADDAGVLTTSTDAAADKSLSPLDAQEVARSLLELLPADGARLALTSLSGGVDLEAVADCCGSLLTLLENHPHWFVVEKMGDKWFVGRRHKVGAQAVVAAPPATPFFTPPVPTAIKRVGETRGLKQSDEFQRLAQLPSSVVDTLISSVPSTGSTLYELREALGASTLATLHTLSTSLRFFFKHHPAAVDALEWTSHHHIRRKTTPSDTTREGTGTPQQMEDIAHVMRQRAGVTSLTTSASIEGSPEYAADDWLVEIDLDVVENSNDVTDAVANTDEPQEVEQRPATVLNVSTSVVTPPSGVRRVAPPPPPSRKLAPAVGSFTPLNPTRQVQPSAHVGAASATLVELLLECVPTFPVPTTQLCVSTTLCRALQTSSLPQLLRRFPRLFIVDSVVGTVHIKPTFTHPRAGAADSKYASSNVTTTTSAKSMIPFESAVQVDSVMLRQMQGLISGVVLRSKKSFDVTSSVAHNDSEIANVDGKTSSFSKVVIATSGPPPAPAVELPSWASMLESVTVRGLWASLSTCHLVRSSQLTNEQRAVLASHKELFERHHTFIRFQCAAVHAGNEVKSKDEVLRLRPWWQSPSSLDAQATLPDHLLTWLEKNLRPVWSPMARLMSKADPVLLNALRDCGSTFCSGGGAIPARWVGLEHQDCIIGLALIGRSLWVSPCGSKIRRYCADPHLDDHTNIAVELLHVSLPAVMADPECGMVDLETHLTQHSFSCMLQPDLTRGPEAPQALVSDQLIEFLRRHIHKFALERDAATSRWRIGRYSAFRGVQASTAQSGVPQGTPLRSSSTAVPKSGRQLPAALFATHQSSGWAAFKTKT